MNERNLYRGQLAELNDQFKKIEILDDSLLTEIRMKLNPINEFTEFDVEGVLDAAGAVSGKALVTHADTIVEDAVDGAASQQTVFADRIEAIEKVVPIGLRKGDLDRMDDGNVIEVLAGGQRAQGEDDENELQEF